jgi:hypothetical protein
MEYEEAIRYLKILKHYTDNDSVGELHKQAYDVAIKACKKQTQKKPSYYGDEDDRKILCPYCETDLYDDRECGFNNCPYCGQAINWEGAEENE